ncbi:MAG TPA: tetratricopeptide repeat protein, partial [Cyclobacteriaceae bacterium]|nr:tetratricopeptide repeat protein [Cyclobacteriaceae bacterium]
NSFYSQQEYDKALLYYEKSLAIREQRADKTGMAAVLNNIGNIYMDTNVFDKALETLFKAASINEELGLREVLATNFINIGKVYQKNKESKKALDYFLQAKQLLDELGSKTFNAQLNAEIGRIYSELNQDSKALSFLLQSIEEAKASKNISTQASAYGFLMEHYRKTNNYKSAFEVSQLHAALKDSLESLELKSRIHDLEAKYESGKKEAEIALLKAEQELKTLELEKQRANLTLILFALAAVVLISIVFVNRYRVLNRTRRQLEMEKMRSQIARDLHDDLGSTLSSINIISNMALNSNNQAENYFQRIREQSSRMMDNMSDIVWSINPNNDSLAQLIIKMKEFAAEILEPKNINYTFEEIGDTSNIKLDVEKRKNLYLIFKESINNAAKYSEGKNVFIKLLAENQHLLLVVQDDGKGFDQLKVKNGNGLKNMEHRAQSIGGKISRSSATGQGTNIQLQIPIT